MNFEFIESRQTRDEVVKIRGVGIADEEIVHYKGESGGVGVVAEEHVGGGFGQPTLGEKSDKTKLRQESGLKQAGDSLRTSQKRKGLPWE
jgi:hypothetical protein